MKAIERAVQYLNIKPRTEHQVRKYLEEKGYDDAEILEAVEQLKEYRYIDDMSFASMYFELGFEKGRGIGRIRRELAEKGVSRETVQEAFESLETVPDQNEEAMKIGRAAVESAAGRYESVQEMLSEMSYDDKCRLQAKVARKLAGRGFSGEIAYRVAKEVTSESGI